MYELEDQFGEIVMQTFKKIKEACMDASDIRIRLSCVLAKYKGEHDKFLSELEEFDRTNLDIYWSKLNHYWDYMNWTLLDSFIRRLRDSSLREAMDNYKACFKFFEKCTRVCDFVNSQPLERAMIVRPHLKKFVLDLKLNWKVCTLEDLDNLKGHIIRKFNLPNFCMILQNVKLG